MLQSDDRFKQYSCCLRWIQKSPQFQNNLLNSFDLEKFLHQSSFLGLVSIGPVLHCTQNILLPNLIPRKIWILSPNETVSVSLPSTSINFCFCQLESTVESNFISQWCGELEVPFLLYSKSSLLPSVILMLDIHWTCLQMMSSYLMMSWTSLFFLFVVSCRYWPDPSIPVTCWLQNSFTFSLEALFSGRFHLK